MKRIAIGSPISDGRVWIFLRTVPHPRQCRFHPMAGKMGNATKNIINLCLVNNGFKSTCSRYGFSSASRLSVILNH